MSEQALVGIYRPSISAGSYPQRPPLPLTEFEQSLVNRWHTFRRLCKARRITLKKLAKRVSAEEAPLKCLTESELDAFISEIKGQLRRQGFTLANIIKAFALIREVAFRTLQKRHYNVQLYGGWLIMNGVLAEMQTGEGKTLTITLPACTAALAGIPVHIITANDYLASRDSELMQPLYQRLGLAGGFVVDGMELPDRQQAYRCDIVNATSQQLAFDYLRDRIAMENESGPLSWQYKRVLKQRQNQGQNPVLLRGLCFAIVDEADSVLIDEAVTPLIITKALGDKTNPKIYADGLFLASLLIKNEDYLLKPAQRSVELTPQGEQTLAELAEEMDDYWQNPRQRDALVQQALAAEHIYQKNKHYIVKENKVMIVDESTGRVMEDRSWEKGLHQLVEAKESCEISEQREVVARISYQQFFSRYHLLGATSGTAMEVERELRTTYGLNVMKVPANSPPKRKILPPLIFLTSHQKHRVFIDTVEKLFQKKQPVLIGTRTVSESEEVSEMLTTAGLPQRILNAKQDQHEADVVARAGQQMAITVATNMAGRGTDIPLGEGVANLGGLHVIALNCNDTSRIERQLFGRCARQGDAGSAQIILSLEDDELAQCGSFAMLKLAALFCFGRRSVPALLARRLVGGVQNHHEKVQRRNRKILTQQDRRFSKLLAFSGKFE